MQVRRERTLRGPYDSPPHSSDADDDDVGSVQPTPPLDRGQRLLDNLDNNNLSADDDEDLNGNDADRCVTCPP